MRVVGLGAICDLDLSPYAINDERQNSFTVSEFALLDNGERVILHAERGYGGRIFPSGNVWAHETVETIAHNVLNTVLPDDDDTEDEHPWEWLAELAEAQGIDVTADDLRPVPYEVVLTERVIRRLSMTESKEEDVEFKRRLQRWAATELPVFRLADWDGTGSLGDSVRAGSIASDGTHRFFGVMAQDMSHRRSDSRGDAVTVTSSRPDPARLFARLGNLSTQIYKSRPRDDDTAEDANRLSHEWEERLRSGEFAWAPTVFSVDGAPTEFQVLVVDDVWFALAHLDEDVDIEILGVHTPVADLRLTRVPEPSAE